MRWLGAFMLMIWLGIGVAEAANVVSERSRLWPQRVIAVIVCDDETADRLGHAVCRPPTNFLGIVNGEARMDTTEAQTVRSALARWNQQFGSNIRLQEREDEPAGAYVVFRGSSGPKQCSTSRVGYRHARRQTFISIGAGCTPRSSDRTREGTVLHEIMHAIGVYHEQQRFDRGRMIRLGKGSPHYKRRAADWETYCDPVAARCDEDDRHSRALGDYDFASIMHYALLRKPDGTLALTAAGKERLARQALDPAEVGQRERFSSTDIRAVRILYPDRHAAVQAGAAQAQD